MKIWRSPRDASARGKQAAKYGVFLNVHHLKNDRHVTLHKLPCNDYLEHCQMPPTAEVYKAHKDHTKFNTAINNASKLSLNWHAKIRACRECWKNRPETAEYERIK